MLTKEQESAFFDSFYTPRGARLRRRLVALPPSLPIADALALLARSEGHASEARRPGLLGRVYHRVMGRVRFDLAEAIAARLERKEASKARPALVARAEDADAREWREAFDQWREDNAAYKARIDREREEWIREQARRDDERAATKPAELVAQAVEEHQAAELVGDPPPAGDAVAELVAEILAGPTDAGQQETAEFPAYTGAPQSGE